MSPPIDVAVVGLGGVGAAALYHAARLGVGAVGFDQYEPPHDEGSSHGESRIFRVAYFEDDRYVPLARRSLELWRQLEVESESELLQQTGGLDGGPEEGRLFTGALAACERHGLEHEVLDAAAMRARFPALRVREGEAFVLQPDAGVLDPEGGITAHLQQARALGAQIRTGSTLERWSIGRDGIELRFADGSLSVCRSLILSSGRWSAPLLAVGPEPIALTAPQLAVERQVVGWLDPADPTPFSHERLPVFNREGPDGHYYGVPALRGRGPKIGRFGHLHERVAPEAPRQGITRSDVELLQGWADSQLRGAGAVGETSECWFTHSADGHFVVDRIPGLPVAIACGLSGHGYKFVPALGEALAHLSLSRDPPVDLTHLRWNRPGLSARFGGS
jgi:sarcosine oxidase